MKKLIIATLMLTWVTLQGVRAEDKTVTIRVTTTSSSERAAEASKTPFSGQRAAVDVAVLLDTSNSMDGLINQAKSQLWTIVQQFAAAKKNGQTPLLRVALFEYGNSGLPAAEGYIRQVVPLTDDLDVMSEALFALKTNGGDEYCGQVIGEAIKRLDWSSSENSYKAIFIAGNEPFTQGSVDFRKSCKTAIEKGVVVNTIHCGAYAAGVSGKWQEGAELAEGKYLNIDQDKKIVHIPCPQDKLIIELNAKLNKTYLWYGVAGQRRRLLENQVAQDRNAAALSESVLLSRTRAKASAAYRNTSRDLVDALAADAKALGQIPKDHLPAELQDMSPEQRQQRVEVLGKERKELQKQIAQLNRERTQHLAKIQKEKQAKGEDTLADAVITAVQGQLRTLGYQVGE